MINKDETAITLTKDHEEMLDELSRLLRVMRRGPWNHTPVKLSRSQGELLEYLDSHGPISLETLMGSVKNQDLEKLLSQLKDLDLVCLQPDPQDSREGFLTVTDAGRGLLRSHLVHGQGKLLHILHHHGEMCSGELAERMDIRPSSLTEKLAKLEAAGLVQRRPDPQDFRRTLVALGSSGLKFAKSGSPRRNPAEQEMARALTPGEAAAFGALCKKISDHMESLPAFCHHRPKDAENGSHRHCHPDDRRQERGLSPENRTGPQSPKRNGGPEEKRGPKGPKKNDGREFL